MARVKRSKFGHGAPWFDKFDASGVKCGQLENSLFSAFYSANYAGLNEPLGKNNREHSIKNLNLF